MVERQLSLSVLMLSLAGLCFGMATLGYAQRMPWLPLLGFVITGSSVGALAGRWATGSDRDAARGAVAGALFCASMLGVGLLFFGIGSLANWFG